MNDNWKYLAALPPCFLWIALFIYMLLAEQKMKKAVQMIEERESRTSTQA